MIYSGGKGHTFGGKLSLFGDKLPLWRALGELWTNPPKNWPRLAPPPFLAMSAFWEHLVSQPKPYHYNQNFSFADIYICICLLCGKCLLARSPVAALLTDLAKLRLLPPGHKSSPLLIRWKLHWWMILPPIFCDSFAHISIHIGMKRLKKKIHNLIKVQSWELCHCRVKLSSWGLRVVILGNILSKIAGTV